MHNFIYLSYACNPKAIRIHVMTKLTKYKSYTSLKLSSPSNVQTSTKDLVPASELEEFLNLLQQKLMKTRKTKNDKT